MDEILPSTTTRCVRSVKKSLMNANRKSNKYYLSLVHFKRQCKNVNTWISELYIQLGFFSSQLSTFSFMSILVSVGIMNFIAYINISFSNGYNCDYIKPLFCQCGSADITLWRFTSHSILLSASLMQCNISYFVFTSV